MKKTRMLFSALGIIALLLNAAIAGAEDIPEDNEPAEWRSAGMDEIAKMAAKVWIITTAKDLYDFLVEAVDKNLRTLILSNPQPEIIASYQGFFIKLAQPFFVLAIVITAAYILLFSESPKGRTKAKGVVFRLIFTMVLVSLSPYITWALLTASGTLAGAIISQSGTDTAAYVITQGTQHLFTLFWELTLIHRTGGVELMLLWETFLLILNFAFTMRYLLVILWNTLLPFSLLMYSFSPTKTIGKKFLHQTFLWIFVQVGWAMGVMVVAAAALGMASIAPDLPAAKIGIASLLVLLTSPMMILGVMDWLSMGVEVVEIVNAAPLSVAALSVDEMKVEREVITEEEALQGV
jgi:hypothetical protein